MAHLASYWHQKGWRVTIVTVASAKLDFYELPAGVERIALDLVRESTSFLTALTSNLQRIWALRKVLRQVRPDIALALMTSSNIQLGLAALGLSDVVTVGSERVYPPQYPLSPFWERLRSVTYGLLHGLVVLTAENRDWMIQETRAKQLTVIPNPVSWPLPEHEPFVLPNRPLDRCWLLGAGRLSGQKGFDLLISAFSKIASQCSAWDLVIVGEGPDKKKLEQQVVDLGLEKRVVLPGRVGNIGEWYQAAELYVMSSRFEGFPNTLVEAMASGLPAVSFDCDTGPRDIIRHSIDGLLVPQQDTSALAEALEKLMLDPTLRETMAEQAKEVRKRLSMERVAVQWETLFQYLSSKKLK